MGRYPENAYIKDSVLSGRTSESTPRFHAGAPGGARFLRVQVPSLPGSGKDIAEGKGVHREVESERCV